jgi:iron complex transport system substrate-binding protein
MRNPLTKFSRPSLTRTRILALTLTFALALGAVPLSACITAPTLDGPGSYTFTDDLGNRVVVNNPQRVVACLSSFAQTWQLAGGEALVGLTEDAKTEGNVALPSGVQYVGNYDSLNLEAIVALEPDFVILSAASRYRQTDLKEALRASGITIAYFNVTHFEDYLRMLKTFTDITGRADLYAANGTDVQEKIEAIKAQVATFAVTGKKPTVVFFITESRGTRIQNGETIPGRILTELGCTNLADTNASQLTEFSIEALIQANPDFVFVLPMGNNPQAIAANLAVLEGNPAWNTIPAVRNGHYFKVDQEHYLYKPNNHWDQSYQILFDRLYK